MILKTVLKYEKFEFEERKSIFIGHINRVETEEDAKKIINDIKTKYSDARHNVYAYVIGEQMLVQRYSDDGEPQGTAGIPILEVIKKNNLKDVIIVVTRYFGGILLGVGGLTRAYVKSASELIKNSKLVDKVLGNNIIIKIDYDLMGKVQYFLNENNLDVHDVDYSDKVKISIRCAKEGLKFIKSNIIELTSNKLDIEISDDVMYFKSKDKYYLSNEI